MHTTTREFLRPGSWPRSDGIYPREAGQLIEQFRRFIGHERLLKATAEYNAISIVAGGVRQARLRERQPLIEAFTSYERATHHRQRPLRIMNDELAGLANVAAHYAVVGPTLTGSLARHHREKLVDLNGQMQPLLLEWKTASHFARANNADLSWINVDGGGAEFFARAAGFEWTAECKRQSHMIVELVGQTESDEIADLIFERLSQLGLKGRLSLQIPLEFDRGLIRDRAALIASLEALHAAGAVALELPGNIRLSGEVLPLSGHAIRATDWELQLRDRKKPDARLYSHARASDGWAVDPIEIEMIGPRRAGVELVEYLWERKFKRAAEQCTDQRAAVLSFEWEDLADPSIFAESQGIQQLLLRTFDEYRHVAAITMLCDRSPEIMRGVIEYSVGAYLARSSVTRFPEVANLMRLG